MHTAFRELPVGARQQQAHECITSKQRTEAPMGCVDCAGFARYRVIECRIFRNKSGTAEEFSPLSLIYKGQRRFFL